MGNIFEEKDGVLKVFISGEIDHHKAKVWMDRIESRFDGMLPRKVILDCSAVTFMDSSGIALVMRVLRKAKQVESIVEVERIPNQARKVLQAAGLERMMKIS